MNETQSEPRQEPTASLQASVIARRRMLLASLGKGSAVVAAVSTPMHSLAAIGTLSVTADGRNCTISGNLSGVNSRETNLPTCGGVSQGYYHNIENWPGYSAQKKQTTVHVNGGGVTVTPNTLFATLFGSGPSEKLIDILPSGSVHRNYQNESHWICAVLNGTPGSIGAQNNFPYTAQEVINLYKDPTKRDSALLFFANFMETL